MSGPLSGNKTGPIDWCTTLLSTRALGWPILVRLLVGLVVFLPGGIQKLASPDVLGAVSYTHLDVYKRQALSGRSQD